MKRPGLFRADVGQRIATERDAEGRVWTPLFPLGEWHRSDFPGGKLTLTSELFTEFIANWKAAGSPALPVDYHHDEADEASGWIESLRIGASGCLEGAIKWTADAAELIKADKYRYLSPTWAMQHVSRTSGEKGGPWLYGAALLNDPYFLTLPRVAATATPVAETTQPPPTKEKSMTFAKRIAAAFGMPEDTSEDALVAACEDMKKSKASNTDEANKLKAALTAKDADTAKLAARVESLESENKKHAVALFDRDFEALIASGIAEGRAGLPAMKDTLKLTATAIGEKGLEHVGKIIAGLSKVPLAPAGIGGKPEESTDAVKQVEALVAEKMKAGMKSPDAYRQVGAENPQLMAKANAPLNSKVSA